ncbi:MAG: hypothetical protein R6U63_00110 [Longimicrobiales bacterium]
MRLEGWILILAGLAAVGLVTASSVLLPEPPRRMTLPTAGELVALERYLTPVAVEAAGQVGVPPTVVIDGNPFRGPQVQEVAAPAEGPRAAEPAPRWTVTAIMVAGEQRVAIVNDRMVRPGDRLDDGARIAAVERDHVVLITPGGERRRLELER